MMFIKMIYDLAFYCGTQMTHNSVFYFLMISYMSIQIQVGIAAFQGLMKALLFHVHDWFGISRLLQDGYEISIIISANFDQPTCPTNQK